MVDKNDPLRRASLPPRPDDTYIAKLQARANVWNRLNEDANKTVFEDLDSILDATMKEAYVNKHFEGFAHIERLRDYLRVTFPLKLKLELETVKKLT